MALCRASRRPIGGLYSRFSSCEYGYCNRASIGTSTADIRENRSSSWVNYADPSPAFGFFSRRFAAMSEHMNLIKQLRERTSAPMKDVKSALVDCDWDIDAAQKELRKKGKVLAIKKASRVATEGILALACNERKAALIELNCETDFVARNDIFQCLALSLAKQALLVENPSQQISGVFPVGPECLEDSKLNLKHPKLSGETTVQDAITEVAAMMGENVRFRRAFVMSASPHGMVSTYVHASPQPGLGRIAGILSFEAEDGKSQLNEKSQDAIQHTGSELAMHIVAAKPLFLVKEDVSSEALESEREILKSQAETTAKSQMAIEKMVAGRLRKYYEEVVLMEQKFILNDTIYVKAMLNNLSKEVGLPLKIGSYLRLEVGEGIQRVEESNMSEPLAQAA